MNAAANALERHRYAVGHIDDRVVEVLPIAKECIVNSL